MSETLGEALLKGAQGAPSGARQSRYPGREAPPLPNTLWLASRFTVSAVLGLSDISQISKLQLALKMFHLYGRSDKSISGVPGGHSRLRIRRCHCSGSGRCYGAGSIHGRGTSTFCGRSRKQREREEDTPKRWHCFSNTLCSRAGDRTDERHKGNHGDIAMTITPRLTRRAPHRQPLVQWSARDRRFGEKETRSHTGEGGPGESGVQAQLSPALG